MMVAIIESVLTATGVGTLKRLALTPMNHSAMPTYAVSDGDADMQTGMRARGKSGADAQRPLENSRAEPPHFDSPRRSA